MLTYTIATKYGTTTKKEATTRDRVLIELIALSSCGFESHSIYHLNGDITIFLLGVGSPHDPCVTGKYIHNTQKTVGHA